MSFKFWQQSISSIENTGTFMAQYCWFCYRFWHPDSRPEARPICVMTSWNAQEMLKSIEEENPYSYDLPEWDPLGCSYYMDK